MIRVIVAIAAAALISTFLSPTVGLNETTLATFIGFLIALVITLMTFDLPGLLLRRRRVGEWGRFQVLPWALVIAVLFVVVSRVGNLQPGYLYGLVLGLIFARDVPAAEEGREAAYGAAWTLAVSVAAWLALGWFRDQAPTMGNFEFTLATTLLAAVIFNGMEAVAFGLMPFHFMPGWVVYRWNRPIWAVLFFLSGFAFFHILIGPNSGYLANLSGTALLAAFSVFLVFSVVTLGFWAYFRFRPARGESSTD